MKINGHYAMESWDRTWRPGKIPVWLRKNIRRWAIRNGKWVAGPVTAFGRTIPESFLPWELFDHWGSVRRGNVRVLVAQPYHRHDKIAVEWAMKMGCRFEYFRPGPWHEKTHCYIFSPL